MFRLPVRRDVLVSEEVYGRHMCIFGGSGMGKSKLLLSLAQQIFESGQGATIVDKHGDLAREVIRIVPKDRQDDVLWYRIGDPKCSLRVNVSYS